MTAIEIASSKGFTNLWLESDSKLVILAFRSNSGIPWCLSNRWQNCLARIRTMRFFASHIYREGNTCADSIANIGLSLASSILFWSDDIPDLTRGSILGIGWEWPILDLTPFEKVLA